MANGQPVSGADLKIPLTVVADPLPGGWSYLQAGTQLAVASADLPRLDQALRGQLLLVREDADGRVLARGATQIAAL